MIEDDRNNRGSEPFVTGVRGQVPPLVTTNFLVKDQGNTLLTTYFFFFEGAAVYCQRSQRTISWDIPFDVKGFSALAFF